MFILSPGSWSVGGGSLPGCGASGVQSLKPRQRKRKGNTQFFHWLFPSPIVFWDPSTWAGIAHFQDWSPSTQGVSHPYALSVP